MHQVTVLYCIQSFNFYMLYITAQKTDLKNYLYIIFTKHYTGSIMTHFLKKKKEKKLSICQNLKNAEDELYERREETMHTNFHRGTAPFPRTGDH